MAWCREFLGSKLLVPGRGFSNDAGMTNFPQPAGAAANVTWNEDLVYATLGDPVRRRLLLALARGGPQPGVDLMGGVGRRLSATLKHLAVMRASGMVLMQENRKDGRRLCYALSPAVPVVKTETGVVIDFGFCLIRL